MSLSIEQIAAVAAAAGFSGDDLATAVAIALAESSGNPQAYNPETAAGAPVGKGSFGLWQIYLNAHPEFSGQNLFDPQTNAAAAYSVYAAAGGSFTPWSTFGSGAYLSQLNAVVDTISPPAAAPDTTASTDTSGTGNTGGFNPTGGDLATLLAVGALAFWAVSRLF